MKISIGSIHKECSGRTTQTALSSGHSSISRAIKILTKEKRKMKLLKNMAVAAGLMIACVLAGAVYSYGQSAPEAITGAGSTWVYPLVAKWSAAYETKTGTKINYQSIGSGG